MTDPGGNTFALAAMAQETYNFALGGTSGENVLTPDQPVQNGTNIDVIFTGVPTNVFLKVIDSSGSTNTSVFNDVFFGSLRQLSTGPGNPMIFTIPVNSPNAAVVELGAGELPNGLRRVAGFAVTSQ